VTNDAADHQAEHADALSRVRNAARSVTDDLLRFERAMDRFKRAVGEAGGVTEEVMEALNQGCDTTERRRAFDLIHSRLTSS
jgi:hypothetical protein